MSDLQFKLAKALGWKISKTGDPAGAPWTVIDPDGKSIGSCAQRKLAVGFLLSKMPDYETSIIQTARLCAKHDLSFTIERFSRASDFAPNKIFITVDGRGQMGNDIEAIPAAFARAALAALARKIKTEGI